MKPTKERSDALKNTLNKLKSQFAEISNDSNVEKLSLERMQYDKPNDEQLKKSAEYSVGEKYDTAIKNEKDLFENKKNAVQTAIDEANIKAKENDEDIENNYNSAKQSLENQSIKRGLQRSSIIMGELDNLENQKLMAKSQVSKDLNGKIDKLNDEIRTLSSDLEKSLKSFDMERAIEINERLEKLKEERESKVNEVTKYNNELTQKETEFNNSLKEKYPEAFEREKEKVENDIANEVIRFYMEYDDPKEAFEDFIKDKSMSGYLGKNYQIVKNILDARF